jgi:transcriptional regulator with XRE-family HTH domain
VPRSLHTEQYAAFLSELRAAREASAVTQVQLAQRLAVGQGVISKSERGARRLDVVELIEWLTALGLDPADFVARVTSQVVASGTRTRLAQRMIARKPAKK